MSATDAAREAARLTDPVEHGWGLLGMMLGAALGAALVIATGGTGLLFVAALLGGVAAGGLGGGKIARGLAGILGSSGISTGVISPSCSPNIIINGLRAARTKLDGANCDGVYGLYHFPMPTALIAEGSARVMFNDMPAARKGDKLICGGKIEAGSTTVLIGGGTVRLLEVNDPEEIMTSLLEFLGMASLGILLGGYLAGMICGAALLEALAGMALFVGAQLGVGLIADSLGLDDNWKELLSGAVDIGGLALFAKLSRAEPIDVVSGELIFRSTDLILHGTLAVDLTRTYFSGLDDDGLFGPKWRSTWGEQIEIRDGKAVLQTEDGRSLRFPLPGAGESSKHGEAQKLTLSRTSTGFVVDGEGKTRRFEHVASGRYLLTSIEDRNGNAIGFEHAGDGTLRAVRHNGGYYLDVEGQAGLVKAVHLVSAGGARETLVRYEYDAERRLDAIIDAEGREFRFVYDAVGNVVRWTDRNQHWYEYRYDADGRCVETSGPDGLLHYRFVYDPFSKSTSVIDSLGHVTKYYYDRKHRVNLQNSPDGGVVVTKFDRHGNRIEEIDAEGGITTYQYDQRGNLTSMTDATGGTRLAAFNAMDLPLQVIDEAGNTWLTEYDARGNVEMVTGPSGEKWSFEHDARGRLKKAVDPFGHEKQLLSTSAGLLAKETDWCGHTMEYHHDERGRLVERRDDTGRRSLYSYDARGHLISVVLPTHVELTWRYDAEGNCVEHKDGAGQRTRYTYGALHLLKCMQRPGGGRLGFEHDTEGRLRRLINERGESYLFRRGPTGHVTNEQDYAGRERTYVRDRAGRCVSIGHRLGEIARLERDAAGRVIRKVTSDGIETSYGYDACGKIRVAKNADTSVHFERDAWGRLIGETQGAVKIESVYDLLGRRCQRRSTNGDDYSFEHDANGRVASLKIADGDSIAFSRDSLGREIARTTPSGLAVRHEYDSMSHITRQVVDHGSGTDVPRNLLERLYSYNTAGDPIEVRDSRWGVETFSYDADGSPVRTRKSGLIVETFSYDTGGALLHRKRSALSEDLRVLSLGADELRYSTGGRLSAVGTTRYEYDEEGRVVARAPADGSAGWEYRWSPEGLLRSVRGPDGQTWIYAYDPFGRRVCKRGPGCETIYVWDGDNLVEERSAAGALIESWVYEPGTFKPLIKRDRGRTYHCVTDPIGTPRELVTGDGHVVWCAALTTWGEVASVRVSDVDCSLRFPGQYEDAESGLHYNRYRYYDPSAGCYISPDPIGLLGGSNPYSYVHNPLAWIDPWGLMPWRWNPKGMGHHLIPRGKANSAGLPLLGTGYDTPSFFPDPYTSGDHEAFHQAQKSTVGKLQGPWTGTPEELIQAARDGLVGTDHMRGDLRIPSTGEVLAKNVTPTEAFDKLMQWHESKTGGNSGVCG